MPIRVQQVLGEELMILGASGEISGEFARPLLRRNGSARMGFQIFLGIKTAHEIRVGE